MIQNNRPNGLRVIKTARSIAAINDAANRGFFPQVKKIEPSEAIRRKVAVVQNENTGEIRELSDFREAPGGAPWNTVIEFTWFYPHCWEAPYAAYLIPSDIRPGERVWVEDLIEDLVGGKWNQGDQWRLGGCEAVWDGAELRLDYDEREIGEILG